MLSILVLISGSGSNLKALLEACDNPLFPAKILAVGADNPAPGLAHAEQFGVPTFVVEPGLFESRGEWSEMLLENVRYHNPDLVVLAGFMKVLPENFVSALSPNLINMHPSLLPAFPGAHAVRDALAAGANTTGATVHIVDAGVDTGPVLAQREVAIAAGVSETELHEQIKAVERTLIVEVVAEIAEGKLNLSERAN
ncbi:MAG: phosphoribosylglycinamide formyltransferase [Actinomycetota bacterium]|nr:phosphoribosylglycinamide formyltransferase [Actinomycetota bacterium]